MNPKLVLVVGDMFVPQRSPDISDQFKSILIPNKLQHVLSLGNIGSRERNDWLKSLSNDFHQVKGDYDEGDIPEKKVVQNWNDPWSSSSAMGGPRDLIKCSKRTRV